MLWLVNEFFHSHGWTFDYSYEAGSGSANCWRNPPVCHARTNMPITNQIPPAIFAGVPNPHQITAQNRKPNAGSTKSASGLARGTWVRRTPNCQITARFTPIKPRNAPKL